MCKNDEKQGDASSEFVIRSCCRSAPERATFFDPTERPNGTGEAVREVVEADLAPDPVVAYHEAGHAVVGLMFGMTPEAIVAGSGGFVRWQDKPPSPEAELVMTMAGDFAGGLAVRVEYRPFDSELAPWIDLIRKPAGGFCDRCRIIRQLLADTGIDAPDRAILSAYRAAEVRTLEILRRNDVRAAIRAVADALTKTGRLTGVEATEIAARYVQPGELKQET
ncbi:hypothetical protein GR247_12750 [Rhizobium leguminosarum]|nr:hypothetical protein [Rhizobium leguminosarum]